MIARQLRWQLAIIAAFAALAAAWVARGPDASWPQATAAFLAVMLLPPTVTIAATFVAARLMGSSVPADRRLGFAAALRYALAEWWAFVLLFMFVQPFERRWLGPDRLRGVAPGERPVLLVHGYACNRGVWWRLRRRLEAAGHCVATVDLEPPYGSIGTHAEVLRRRVEEVLAETGAAQLVLVAHSMGGLAARVYLAKHGAERVAALITLGSPHHGSALARFAIGTNGREMEPGSAFLRRLAEPVPAPHDGVTVLYSMHDNFVLPQAVQALAGMENVELAGIGHLRLVLAPEVARVVLTRLAMPA